MEIAFGKCFRLLTLCSALSSNGAPANDQPRHTAELVFPLHHQHNHAPAIVEYPNGDLLVSWYRGSGERRADDVAVYGARRRKGADKWSEPFVMADTPGFPDGNTAMFIDARQRLWLFWPVVIANTWESCLTSYRVATQYETDGAPKWQWQGQIFLKPESFAEEMEKALAARLKTSVLPGEMTNRVAELQKRIGDKLLQRLGWQPRCKPTVLRSGRIRQGIPCSTGSRVFFSASIRIRFFSFAARKLGLLQSTRRCANASRM